MEGRNEKGIEMRKGKERKSYTKKEEKKKRMAGTVERRCQMKKKVLLTEREN
jgi:hypothetical protein